MRVLSISKEILALTNTWFFAFSIHSMKFCLLQFSPFFVCHFIKKLKRIKKGEKFFFFFNEGCGFLFTKRKIKVVIFLSYDHWIWDQKLCISEGRGGKHSGIFYIVFIPVNSLHFQFYQDSNIIPELLSKIHLFFLCFKIYFRLIFFIQIWVSCSWTNHSVK